MRTNKCIIENKTKVLRYIFAFFFYFFPFLSHSKVLNMEIFVKDFSGTTSPRILKFCTNIRYNRLNCVLKNQPHMAYQSLYLSIFFLSNNFHLISSASMSAAVLKFCIHNEDNQVYFKLLMFIFAFFFYFPFFLSLQM